MVKPEKTSQSGEMELRGKYGEGSAANRSLKQRTKVCNLDFIQEQLCLTFARVRTKASKVFSIPAQ
jgi:hypothetical protein